MDDAGQAKNGAASSGAQSASSEAITPAGKNLIDIMGRKWVVRLALGAVAGAAALCLIGIFLPGLFTTQFARFFLCLLIAFLFAVFVFTFYPTDYRLEVGKIIHVAFVLVGPAALWIGLFLLFWYLLPQEVAAGKVFRPEAGDPALYSSTTWVLNWKPQAPRYYILQGSANRGSVIPIEGFYVEFDGANTIYTAEIGAGPDKQDIKKHYHANFNRAASTYRLTLLKEEGSQ